jgi:proteasome component ECM29
MKISKNAGSLLKPHVSLLVVPLLESITTLEPQVVNYYSLHAASNQAAQDKVRYE